MLLKNGVLKEYPANGINFASAGSGVLRQTNEILVRKLSYIEHN